MDGLEGEALRIVETCLGCDDPQERARTIAITTQGRPELRARVDALMDRHGQVFRLLATESFDAAGGAFATQPDRIDSFRITGLIENGGMGRVLKAERDDGVFEQTVAIKLIRADIGDPQARAHFEQERRILARLDHPGIARILDGGEADGRPWLAMEYVPGKPITQALDAVGATLEQRLDAFHSIAQAVAHAHRNLIVHADIKPGNVLMREDGAIKLLDFGIARLIVDLDRDEPATRYPLTRGYAAPERAGGEMPSIGGDVYSLGALLHELLTGALPEAGGLASSVPRCRVDPARLRGDLDAILTRALATEADARYPDVAALLDDLAAYRDHRPVAANAAAGWRYHAIRFLRRHRTGVAITAAAMLMLALAAGAMTILYLRAEQARAQAQARFDDVRDLSRFMLFDLYDDLSDAPGTVGTRNRLARTGRRYLDRLQAVPHAPHDLRLDIARGWRRLASVEGLSGASSLGRPADARASLDKAAAQIEQILADHPGDAAALEERGWIIAGRWGLLPDSSRSSRVNAAAAASFRRALAIAPALDGARLGLAMTEKNRGYDLIWADRAREAVPVLAAALAQLRTKPFGPSLARDARMLEVNLLSRMGDAVYYGGDPAGALRWYGEADTLIARELRRRQSIAWIAKLGESKFNLSGTLEEMPTRRQEALAHTRAGLTALERALAFGPDATLEKWQRVLYSQSGLVLTDLGRYAEAADAAGRSVAMREKLLRNRPTDPHARRDVAVAMPNYALILGRAGRRADACAAARRGDALWEDIRRRGDLGQRDARADIPQVKAAVARYCSGGKAVLNRAPFRSPPVRRPATAARFASGA